MVFRCQRSGKCCSVLFENETKREEALNKQKKQAGPFYKANFGVVVSLQEKEVLEKKAKELGKQIKFLPNQVVVDSISGKAIILDYAMPEMPCAFLDGKGSEVSCMAYEQRPETCRAFPARNFLKSKNKMEFVVGTSFCQADTFFVDYSNLEQGNHSKNEIFKALHDYYGESFVYATLKHLRADLVKSFVLFLASKEHLKPLEKELSLQELHGYLDKGSQTLMEFVEEKKIASKERILNYFNCINFEITKQFIEANIREKEFVEMKLEFAKQ